MKKFLLLVTLALMLPSQILACGGFEGFAPQGKQFTTKDETNVLVWFRNNTETYIVEPAYKGNAASFGIVIPFPAKPTIDEAPQTLFDQLEELTSVQDAVKVTTLNAMPMVGANRGVTVVEQKNVGDFSTTTLSAIDVDSLISWLKNNGYSYTQQDISNFEYYIHKGGYYFVTLKINASRAPIDSTGNVNQSLKPIAFTFTTPQPIISMKISSSDKMQMDFNLYTLADDMYIVPGAAIFYSQEVDDLTMDTVPALAQYDVLHKWLTKSVITMNPKSIQSDLYLQRTKEKRIVSIANPVVVNVSSIPKQSGIIRSTKGSETAIEVDPVPTEPPLPTPTTSLVTPTPSPTPALNRNPVVLISILIALIVLLITVLYFAIFRKKNVPPPIPPTVN